MVDTIIPSGNNQFQKVFSTIIDKDNNTIDVQTPLSTDGDYHLIEKNAEFENFDSFLMTIQKKYRPLYRLDYMVRYD